MKTKSIIKDVLSPKALIPLIAVVVGITLSIIGPSEASSLEDFKWPDEVHEAQGSYDHLTTLMEEQAKIVAYWQNGLDQAIQGSNSVVQALCSQEVVLSGLKYYALLKKYPNKDEWPDDVREKITSLEPKLNKRCDYFQ